jgi:large subunit ribosomal protein L35
MQESSSFGQKLQMPSSKPKETPSLQYKKATRPAGLDIGTWCLIVRNICYCNDGAYLPHLMPKAIARSKTRKSVRKRFKITGRGKILRAQSSRRHLLSSKSAKRKRHLSKSARVDKTDEARIRANLPFG